MIYQIDMKKRKICVVVTARPSYSRVKSALTAIKQHPKLELQLVIAGSALLGRYGNAVDFIEKDGFEIAEKVFMVLEGENVTSMAKTTGLGIMELANVIFKLQPDAVVTIADRFETIATSIAAAYQNIPLVHLQGGEVTGNIDEKVRHANTKLADIHLVASEDAKKRVLKMGEDPTKVFNTGCPSIDLAKEIKETSSLDFDPIKKAKEYEDFGASALSILTEEDFFQGSSEYLKEVKAMTSLPILRKDFMVDEYQIYEAKLIGADCILLIASILNDNEIQSFADLAESLELDYLIEVHDLKELKRVEHFSNAMIGVNNRNLKTFDVDLNNSINLKNAFDNGVSFGVRMDQF